MSTVARLYSALRRHYGPQAWWPGDTPFEVMVGAILTQNTNWRNVEKALANLAGADCLSLSPMLGTTERELAALIRPAGYFNLKARRLLNLCAWLRRCGGVAAVVTWKTERLRNALLGINGVGPETADDILLYALGRDVFVVDTYTQRLFARVGITKGVVAYETLRRRVELDLGGGAQAFGQFHALIVEHAKAICRKKPLCGSCPLSSMCAFARSQDDPAN
jgi:endonuclease III related protein